MSLTTILNIVFLNIIIWIALSLFWSHWTYKIFKPYKWLETMKKKQINKNIANIEKRTKDKNRFYAVWFLLQQIDENLVDGQYVMLGIENEELATLIRSYNVDRNMIVISEFKAKNVEVKKENCDGKVTIQNIEIEHVEYDIFLKNMPNNEKTKVINNGILNELENINEPICFATIDTINYEEVYNSLIKIYGLLSQGGAIIVHDYNHDWDSVKTAVDTFQASILETFVAIPDMYGSVVLIKNKLNNLQKLN